MLLAGIAVNAADYARIDSTVGAWRSIASEEAGNLERPTSFSSLRYALYFALREHTDDPVLIVRERLRGNAPGRYYGIGDVSLILERDFDPLEVLAGLDVESRVVASGDYADGQGSFRLALQDEEAEVLVLLPEAEFELLLVDLRLLPENLQRELAP